MEKLSFIKEIDSIKRLQRKGLTINEAIAKRGKTLEEFLLAIGIKDSFLNSAFENDILDFMSALFDDQSTKFNYNPSMESLDNETIYIYSQSTRTEVSFTSQRLVFNNDKAKSREDLQIDGVCYKENAGVIQRISFNGSVVNDFSKHKERVVTRKHLLGFFELNTKIELDDKSAEVKENNFHIIARDSVTEKDAMYLISRLYGGELKESYAIFIASALQGTVETIIIEDDFFFKNMNNTRNS